MCKAMGLPTGHNLCTTTIEHKLKEREEQQLSQQPPLKQKPQQNGQQAILSAVSYKSFWSGFILGIACYLFLHCRVLSPRPR